ncbi:MAG TPA: hypothetical protein VED20_03320, partial [Streptosporangiaceae bacterium]|nr:hypothetical protein [Streptosporangiaceae bacterium]
GVRISGVLRGPEGTGPGRVGRGAHAAPEPANGLGPPGNPVARPTPMTPVASPRPGQAAGPPWELSRQTGPLPVVPGGADRGSRAAGAAGEASDLPRRVKQASLAPQLRADPPRRLTGRVGPSPASGPSPAEIRQTMSALQRGWLEGRSQRTAGAAADEPPPEPPAGPGPFSGVSPGPGADSAQAESPSPGPDPASGTGVNPEPAAGDEPGGESDGT